MYKECEHLDLFPTPVSQYDLSFLDLDGIIKILDKFEVAPHGLLDDSDSSYGLDFTILYDDELKFLKEELDICINEYVQRTGLQDIVITGSWYNKMKTGRRLNLHRHEGSVLSGAFYLDVDDNSVPLRMRSPLLPYKMNDMYQRMDNQYASTGGMLKPSKGQLILFPSWIEHETDSEQGHRCLISFNTFYTGT